MRKFYSASIAMRQLNGVFCVYKPVGMNSHTVQRIVTKHLAAGLNALPFYKYEKHMQTQMGVTFNINLPVPTTVPDTLTDLSQHRLVLGNPYSEEEIGLLFLHGLDYNSSGVLLMNFGPRTREFSLIATARFLRVYHVKGRFGLATSDCTPSGSLIERSTYKHITHGKLDKACSAAQSGHHRLMFEYAGVRPNSQEAYDMACQGIIRPQSNEVPPMLYGIKCIHFEPPDFTLEIHAINETPGYLRRVIHDTGLKLKSTAVCTHIHRLRYGHFTVDHALLRQQWTVPDIANNVVKCRKLLTPEKLFTNANIGGEGMVRTRREHTTEDLLKIMRKKKMKSQTLS